MRALICGGRQYQDVGFLWKTMDHIHATQPISEVIAGGASGADTLGASWAIERGIPCRVFMADWENLVDQQDQSGIKKCWIGASPIWWWRFLANEERPTWCDARERPVRGFCGRANDAQRGRSFCPKAA